MTMGDHWAQSSSRSRLRMVVGVLPYLVWIHYPHPAVLCPPPKRLHRLRDSSWDLSSLQNAPPPGCHGQGIDPISSAPRAARIRVRNPRAAGHSNPRAASPRVSDPRVVVTPRLLINDNNEGTVDDDDPRVERTEEKYRTKMLRMRWTLRKRTSKEKYETKMMRMRTMRQYSRKTGGKTRGKKRKRFRK